MNKNEFEIRKIVKLLQASIKPDGSIRIEPDATTTLIQWLNSIAELVGHQNILIENLTKEKRDLDLL